MSKVLKEAPLTTRAARAKLATGVHWRSIDPDTHLGYRRAMHGGRWLVRWYKGNGKYAQEPIGTADDALDADGNQTLSFQQAVSRARRTAKNRRAEAAASAAGPIVTVRVAITEYLAEREQREAATGSNKRDARSRLTKHVLNHGKLSDTPLFALTEKALSDWLVDLDGISGTTIRRLANDFKAALNRGARRYRVTLPANIGSVIKNGLNAESRAGKPVSRPAQVFPDDDIRRIIKAAHEIDKAHDWNGDLARLIVVLAATGARFSQIVRLTVADVQRSEGRLMVPTSYKGKGPKNQTHTPVPVGADVLDSLRRATAGRAGSDKLLLRPRWRQTSPTEWRVADRSPWRSAAELKRPWAEIIAKAGLRAGTVPYSLRHSAIVRGIRARLPIRLVAALHDTSTAMIERHYAAYITSALDEIAGRAVVPLLPVELASTRVVPLRA